jgi:hypothetical protein
MATFELKAGDRKYALKYRLSDYEEGAGIFAGASVKFQMMNAAGIAVIDSTGSVLDDDGIVGYAWKEGDTSTAGNYRAEFKITFPDGLVQHYPSSGFIGVSISADVPDS